MSWKDVPETQDTTKQIPETQIQTDLTARQPDPERNQELSGHTNSITKQTTNRTDRTADTNRTNQPKGQSSLSRDLEQFRETAKKPAEND
jgi:hypothetical protein